MSKRDRRDPEEEKGIIVEHSGFGAILGVMALVLALLALLGYFGLLPI